MFRALLWKELRACWILAVLFLLPMSWIVLSMVVDFQSWFLDKLDLFPRWHLSVTPIFESDALLPPVAGLALVFGIFLGFTQGVIEAMTSVPTTGTSNAVFLVHTARSRGRILLAKMVAGIVLYASVVVLPMACAAAAVLSANQWYIPLQWSDARYLGIILLSGVVVYLVVLACSSRGQRQGQGILGAIVLLGGVILAIFSPWFALAVVALATSAALAVLSAFLGFSTREF